MALLVDRLARAGDGVRILTTCREPLRVAGEHAYPLRPLALPAAVRAGSVLTESELGRLSTYAAVSLFLARATAAQPDFRLTPANAAAVAAICARLDGLPLALELAAARTRSLSPDALLPRLDQALKLLIGGDRTLPTRHQTLTATITWSYDALGSNEQQLLDRLSVFPGPFTLDAAEAICGPTITAEEDDLDVLDGIGVLVDRSLLRHHPATVDQPDDRYSLLATIHDYAANRLNRAGQADGLADRHADYYTRLVAYPDDFTRQDVARIQETVHHEFAHLLRALDHLRSDAQPDLDRQVVAYLGNQGQNEECLRLGRRALDRSTGPTAVRAMLMVDMCIAQRSVGRVEAAREWGAEAVEEASAVPDTSVLAQVLSETIFFEKSRLKTRQLLDQLLMPIDDIPHTGSYRPRWVVQAGLESSASAALFVDPQWGESAARHGLATAAHDTWTSYCTAQLGAILTATGQLTEAETLLSAFEPDGGDPRWPWVARTNGLSAAIDMRIATGLYDIAADNFDGLHVLANQVDSVVGLAVVEQQRAMLDQLRGDGASATRRLAAAAARSGLSDENTSVIAVQLAHVRRSDGDLTAAHRHLAEAWHLVAGEETRFLTTILACLLEGATQYLEAEPDMAARLLGLVQAHRGPFLLSPLYDPEQLLASLRDRISGASVDAILVDTAARPLPDDPDWGMVLAALRAPSRE